MSALNRRQLLVAGATSSLLAHWPAQAQTTGSFRIGALNPITGAGANYGGGMQKSILFAADAVNAAGGAAGRKLEVFAEDDQTTPNAAVLAAKKLIEVNKVQAILGTWASGVSLAVMPLTNDANAILMHTSGAVSLADAKTNAKQLGFRYQGSSKHLSKAFVKAAQKEGFKRPAVLALNNPATAPHAEGFRREWTAAGGSLSDFVLYEPNRTSYRSELQQVLRSRPDGIILSGYAPDGVIIIRDWFQTGTKMKWVMPGFAANTQFMSALGQEAIEGIVVVESVVNEGAAAYKQFATQYEAAMGKPAASNVYAAMCFDMVNVLALAVEAAGPNADTATIAKKIHEVTTGAGQAVGSFAEGKALLKQGKKINYEGASSSIDFDNENDVDPTFAGFIIKAGVWQKAYLVNR
ncbi:ABC transporter substrate-binding protein [Hydrogenophaga sp. OTU3427]|uniref:ABC transporter substrate-binding protein n=1 Tax=Hydrogenophaga sp. OTU3427 TaxID=3043856 RepID=UPI00313C69CA